MQEIVISDHRYSYKEDEINKALFVEETLLSGIWWDKVNYKLAFTASMYDVLRKIDTNVTSLYLVYEMWDSVIDKVRKVIYRQERKAGIEELKFYNVRP